MRAATVCLLLCSVIVVSGELNVFMIPHSHCDPGWLMTYQGYFKQKVNRILDAVFQVLEEDSRRRFNWAEISFFSLWYEKQPVDVRARFKALVKDGQFEFIEGGWVQNDEANANLDSVINQVTIGHDYLMKNFAVRPRVGWQIDPFGHSSLTAELHARFKFDAMVINRIFFGTKKQFKDEQTMEFVWKPSPSLGDRASIFTHVLHSHYSAPKQFDFEEGNAPKITSGNVAARANVLVKMLKDRSKHYRSNNLLVTWGDDFKFYNARAQFTNMEQLRDHINADPGKYGVNFMISNVSSYFAALHEEKREWPVFEQDFFPYADGPGDYWTGYYTTRPLVKRDSRSSDAFLRTAEVLYVLARLRGGAHVQWADNFMRLQQAREDTALVQHHDGITGTARQPVADDYLQRMEKARANSVSVSCESAAVVLSLDEEDRTAFTTDRPINTNIDGLVTPVVVHNSLGWTMRRYVGLIVTSSRAQVLDASQEPVLAQVSPDWGQSTPNGEPNRFRLWIYAEVPPLGAATFFVRRAPSKEEAAELSITTIHTGSAAPIKSARVRGVTFKNSVPDLLTVENHLFTAAMRGGMIDSVTYKEGSGVKEAGKELRLKQKFMLYESRRSGAYLFRPDSVREYQPDQSTVTQRHSVGPLVQEVQVNFGSMINHIRVFQSAETQEDTWDLGAFMEVTHTGGVEINKELGMRFETDLDTKGAFFTDNGVEMRERHFRESAPKEMQRNWYPTISTALLRDGGLQLTCITRQARGCTSSHNGELELMLHRRHSKDDGRGLATPNNDATVVTSSLLVALGPVAEHERHRRRWSLQFENSLFVMMPDSEYERLEDYTDKFKTLYTPINELPYNVHMLTLRARDAASDDVILRLAHTFENLSDVGLWTPASVDMAQVTPEWQWTNVREATLSADLRVVDQLEFAESTDVIIDRQSTDGVDLESQNSDQAGVYISQDALDFAKKVAEMEGIERRLLATSSEDAWTVDLDHLDIATYVAVLEIRKDEDVVLGVTYEAATDISEGEVLVTKENNVEYTADARGTSSVASLMSSFYAMFLLSFIGFSVMFLVFWRLTRGRTSSKRRRAR